METPSYIALSRQTALWRQMDVVANNIANMNTPGYKGESMMFAEYLSRSRGEERGTTNSLAYTVDFGTVRDQDVGPMNHTGNPLDLAINGDGYFEVETEFGPLFTRNGRLMLDPDGMIVTSSGHPVLSTDGTPFFIAPNESEITVSADGSVSTETGPIGQISVVSFEDPQALRRVQAGLYDADDMDPEPVERAAVNQGMLEGSTVVPTQEITTMIKVQRAYEMTQKMIETESERQKQAISVLSGARNA